MQFFLLALIGKLVVLFFGVKYFRKLPFAYALIVFQVIFAVICEGYGFYLGHILHQNNLWLFNYYWIIADIGLTGIAGILLLEKKKLKIISVILLLVTLVIWLHNIIAFSINHYAPLVKASIHIALVIIYAMLLVDRLLFTNLKLGRQPDFWLCLSTLLFFGCNIPLYGLFNYLNSVSPQTLKKLFEISLILNFIRYPLVAVSFYLIGQKDNQIDNK